MADSKTATTSGDIHITRETLGKALHQKRLRVDINQREYSWEEEHISDLYQDFAEVIHNGAAGAEHFLGSIVVTKDDAKRPKIVDGQQRLATTFILLAAIRDFVYSNDDDGKERATALENAFLLTVDEDSMDRVPHLELNGSDNEFFRKIILSLPDSPERKTEPERPSHKKLALAAKIAADRIRAEAAGGIQGKAYTSRLRAWKDFVENRARVIWVEVPDDATAFSIFETMNDRGLGLSASDLIKNYLFASVDPPKKPEAYQKWFSMQGAIDSVTEDKKSIVTYVRHYWLSAQDHTTKDKLYLNFKRKITNQTKALALMDSLTSSATLYASLLNPNHDSWNSYPKTLQEKMRQLHETRVTQGRPLLLAAVDFYKNDASMLEKVIETILNWSVRFLVVGGLGSGSLEEKYGEGARELRKGKFKSIEQMLKFFVNSVPSDARFHAAFATADSSKPHLTRYYLERLEYTANPSPPEMQHFDVSKRGQITVEHVLPQSLKGTHDDLGQLVNRLGNLALLQGKKNREIGSLPYDKKRATLEQSLFILTKECGGFLTWGAQEIERRQARLANLALTTWPLIPAK